MIEEEFTEEEIKEVEEPNLSDNILNKKKLIMYTIPLKKYTDFHIRLDYDGFNQREFITCILDAYLEKNEKFFSFLDEIKEKRRNEITSGSKRAKFSLARRKKMQEEDKKEKQMIKKFSLNEEEIENIFDTLEQDNLEF